MISERDAGVPERRKCQRVQRRQSFPIANVPTLTSTRQEGKLRSTRVVIFNPAPNPVLPAWPQWRPVIGCEFTGYEYMCERDGVTE